MNSYNMDPAPVGIFLLNVAPFYALAVVLGVNVIAWLVRRAMR